MSSNRQTVRLQVRCRWWLQYYLFALVLVSAATDREPDWIKVDRWIRRGLVLRMAVVRGAVEV